MIKMLISIIVSLISSSLFASFRIPQIKWENLSEVQKILVIVELQDHLKIINNIAPIEVVSHLKNTSFSTEAYAGDYNCFVAGWPSTMDARGNCLSPKKMNSSYDDYLGCPQDELLCNPTVFGEQLCIKFKNSSEKNNAFSHCEKSFKDEKRNFLAVTDEVNVQDFNDLLATIYHTCASSKKIPAVSSSCFQLTRKLQHFVPDEIPQNYNSALKSLQSPHIEESEKAAIKLEKEMENDMSEFDQSCTRSIDPSEALYCHNLATRIKTSAELLPKLYEALDKKIMPDDCENCSKPKEENILEKSSLPDLSAIQCSMEEMEQKKSDCGKEILCSIGSTIIGSSLIAYEQLTLKPEKCLSSQNDCLINAVSSIVKSLVGMVTGIWDLLGMVTKWVGHKISDFWSRITKVEDKTADSQHIINNMSDEDLTEIKSDPIKWIKQFANTIWEGITEWMKTDVFCEKWSGVPRASKCLEPMKSFDCLSCRTKISGTCSAVGVIAAEILPAFFTGGGANLAARGAKGASLVADFIKASKAYTKVISVVDKLSEVRAIQAGIKTAKVAKVGFLTTSRPTRAVIKLAAQKSSVALKALQASARYKKVITVLEKTAKYTGLKAFSDLNHYAFKLGYRMVDDVAAIGVKKPVGFLKQTIQKVITSTPNNASIISKVEKARALLATKRLDLEPLFNDVRLAYQKGDELNLLKAKLNRRVGWKPSLRNAKVTSKINNQIDQLTKEIILINDRYLQNMHDIFSKEGIPTILETSLSGNYKNLVFDVSSPPTEKYAFEFYRKLKKRVHVDKITLNLKENVDSNSLGFFSSNEKRIEIGPNQAMSLLEDYVNTTGKHEGRHCIFFTKKNKGQESIFHTSYYQGSSKRPLNNFQLYDQYMSTEEVYTFSTDFQTFAQGLAGENLLDLERQVHMFQSISIKNQNFQKVLYTNKDLSESMIKSIDKMLEPDGKLFLDIHWNPNGNVQIQIADEFKRVGVIQLVSPDEVKLVEGFASSRTSYFNELNNHINSTLRNKMPDFDVFSNRVESGSMTNDDKILINELTSQFNSSDLGKKLLLDQKNSLTPALKHTKKQMEMLQKISIIQLEESLKFEKMLKPYENGSLVIYPDQIHKLRQQMFKMAKNVKEGYKGFALKAANSSP